MTAIGTGMRRQMMKASKGLANPEVLNKILMEKLSAAQSAAQ